MDKKVVNNFTDVLTTEEIKKMFPCLTEEFDFSDIVPMENARKVLIELEFEKIADKMITRFKKGKGHIIMVTTAKEDKSKWFSV